MMPISVPVGSQMVHAVGIAWAERYRGTDRMVAHLHGRRGELGGGLPRGVQPRRRVEGRRRLLRAEQPLVHLPALVEAERAATLAEKAFAYGFEGVRVDGNDIFAVYAAVKLAAERARAGEGPTLIEGLTYRLGAHTTSDDPTRYRTDEEVKQWEARDPLLRLERYLVGRGLLTRGGRGHPRAIAGLRARGFEEVEQAEDTTLEDTFRYLFHEMPPILAEQLERRKA